MIRITELREADRGREVIYRTHGAVEYGRLQSWNHLFIFVRYHLRVTEDGRQTARYGETNEATNPEDLEFL